ncbi:MAG TPA: NAD(+) synthase [Vicinamibacteria bacterium]|nr:NAD(+) synthase [Vicinamibacteria bacterium]
MQLLKIALVNLNPTVGALRGNLAKIIRTASEVAEARCGLAAFTEQVLPGYPTEDLVQWPGFVSAQFRALREFASATGKLPFPTVFTVGLTVTDRGLLYNAVAVVAAGEIVGIVPKENLPNYDVFYERRVFALGIPRRVSALDGVPFGDLLFRFPFGTLAVEVCEDLWVPDGPALRRAASGAEIVVNVSASPFRGGVVETRKELIATRAADHEVTLVYVNQFGGQDSLVFDGGGYVNQNGRMVFEAERWREGWSSVTVDVDRTRSRRRENTTYRAHAEAYLEAHEPVRTLETKLPGYRAADADFPTPSTKNFFVPEPSKETLWYEDLVAAMKTGLAGYFEKTGAFERLGVALSGGKDSALTLLIAWLYARDRGLDTKDFIHCFSMPTHFNSETTKGIAKRLAAELGVSFREVPIEDAFEREVKAAEAMLSSGKTLTRLARQNIQARIRGMRMWNWANASRGMWLQTGNMSEKAVGYTTVGGDLMGAYSLLGNLPKTIVIRLLDHLREKHGIAALEELMKTEASAELEEDQEDERDLMPFPVLDACFALFAGEKMMPSELYLALRSMWTDDELRKMRRDYRPGMLKDWVKRFCRLFVGSIFKWVQAPQAVHLGALDLDRERALQIPVVQSPEWLEIEAIDALPD